MAFCDNCGAKLGDNEKFCPNCGKAASSNAPAKAEVINDDDVSANKGISVLSYLGPLVFIPLFARKNSDYAQFHARQGFTLFVIEVAYSILSGILTSLIKHWTINTLSWLASVGLFVIALIGFINCLSGKKKPVPLVGGLDLFGVFTGKK